MIPNVELNLKITDNGMDYFVLERAAESITDLPGLTCEIGLRGGGGTKHIIDALDPATPRTHITIDPYGVLPYPRKDGRTLIQHDYGNAMRNEAIAALYCYVMRKPHVNLLYFPLEDIEFFARFADGVPIYTNGDKQIVNEYALVFFDGPHTTEAIMEETKFFMNRSMIGTMFVYDDVHDFYDHNAIETFMIDNGWGRVHRTLWKASYRRAK